MKIQLRKRAAVLTAVTVAVLLAAGSVAYAISASFTATKIASGSLAVTPPSPTPVNPPTVAITFPTENTNYTTSTAWNAGCGTTATADICGSATAFTGRTITSVTWTLVKTYGTSTDCFVKSSSSWQGSCTTPTSNSVGSGTTSWTDGSLVFGNGTGQLNQNLSNGQTASYTLVVTATDSTGAQGSATRHFQTTK